MQNASVFLIFTIALYISPGRLMESLVMSVIVFTTSNPRITIAVDQFTLDKITEYRFEHRMKNQTQAVLALIEKGMKAVEGNTKIEARNEDEDIHDRIDKLDAEDKRTIYDLSGYLLTKSKYKKSPAPENSSTGDIKIIARGGDIAPQSHPVDEVAFEEARKKAKKTTSI